MQESPIVLWLSPCGNYFFLFKLKYQKANYFTQTNKQIYRFLCFGFRFCFIFHTYFLSIDWSRTNGAGWGELARIPQTFGKGSSNLIEITKWAWIYIPHSLMYKSLTGCCKMHAKVGAKFEFNFLLQRAEEWLCT